MRADLLRAAELAGTTQTGTMADRSDLAKKFCRVALTVQRKLCGTAMFRPHRCFQVTVMSSDSKRSHVAVLQSLHCDCCIHNTHARPKASISSSIHGDRSPLAFSLLNAFVRLSSFV